MNVIDASSLAKYVLKEPGWERVGEILREETRSIDHVVKEVSNSLWRKAVVRKLEPVEIAWRRFKLLKKLIEEGVIVLENELVYLEEAFNIAVREHITIYDALYIAQALRLNAVFITSDEKQFNIARKHGVEIIYVP